MSGPVMVPHEQHLCPGCPGCQAEPFSCEGCRRNDALLEFMSLARRAAKRNERVTFGDIAFFAALVLFNVGVWTDIVMRVVKR